MLVEFIVAVSLPLWLAVEEIARIRAHRPRRTAEREVMAREPRREAPLPAKA